MEDKPKGKSKRVIIIAAASAAVLAAALVILAVLGVFTPGKEYGHFLLRGSVAYYSPGGKRAREVALGSVNAGDTARLRPLYSVTKEGTIIFPALSSDGSYDLERCASDGSDNQSLVSGITRVETTDGGHALFEASGTLYSFDGQDITVLSEDVKGWEPVETGDSVWYVTGTELRLKDLTSGEETVISQKISDSSGVVASRDGRVFRYSVGIVNRVFVDGQEQELVRGTVYGDSADMFYIVEKKDTGSAPVSSLVNDDMKSADATLKPPNADDYTYARWSVEFRLFNGFYLYYTPPEDSSIAISYHEGKTSARGIIDWITENFFPRSASNYGYPFRESEVIRLSSYFSVVKTTESNNMLVTPLGGRYEKVTYHGTGPVVTVNGTEYDTSFTAEMVDSDYLMKTEYNKAVSEYRQESNNAEIRDEIRSYMNKSLGSMYSLYRYTPQEGLTLLADELYSCSKEGGELVTMGLNKPQEPGACNLSELSAFELSQLRQRLSAYELKPNGETESYPLSVEEPEESVLPQELVAQYRGIEPALELEDGWTLLYYSGGLYLYDGEGLEPVANGVKYGAWAGGSRNGIYYVLSGGDMCYYNGKKSVVRAQGIEEVW